MARSWSVAEKSLPTIHVWQGHHWSWVIFKFVPNAAQLCHLHQRFLREAHQQYRRAHCLHLSMNKANPQTESKNFQVPFRLFGLGKGGEWACFAFESIFSVALICTFWNQSFWCGSHFLSIWASHTSWMVSCHVVGCGTGCAPWHFRDLDSLLLSGQANSKRHESSQCLELVHARNHTTIFPQLTFNHFISCLEVSHVSHLQESFPWKHVTFLPYFLHHPT